MPDGLIRGVRTVGLMLLSWLLLVMTAGSRVALVENRPEPAFFRRTALDPPAPPAHYSAFMFRDRGIG